jgi:hypothetical protein
MPNGSHVKMGSSEPGLHASKVHPELTCKPSVPQKLDPINEDKESETTVEILSGSRGIPKRGIILVVNMDTVQIICLHH